MRVDGGFCSNGFFRECWAKTNHSEKGVEKPKHVVVVMLVSQFLELDLCELGQSQFSWFLWGNEYQTSGKIVSLSRYFIFSRFVYQWCRILCIKRLVLSVESGSPTKEMTKFISLNMNEFTRWRYTKLNVFQPPLLRLPLKMTQSFMLSRVYAELFSWHRTQMTPVLNGKGLVLEA